MPGLDTLSGDAVFRCASSLDALREVLADGGDGAGYVVATVDVESVAHARGRIPSLDHDRRFSAPESAGRKPRAAA